MSSGDHGAIRIERSISRRVGGTYAVNMWDGSSNIRKSFKTLKEARKFRDQTVTLRKRMKALGRKIDWNVSGINRIGSTGYIPEDVSDHRDVLRKQIQKAPRSTVYRDGKKFTLIELPEVMT